MLSRRSFTRKALVVGVAGLSGCLGGGGGVVKETSTVTMVNTQFKPRNIHVETGTQVTWTNDNSTEHTVTAASANWSKDTEVPAGGSTTHTFRESGVYDVYCRFHGSQDLTGMSMKIAVGNVEIQNPLGAGGGGGGAGAY